MTTRARTEDEAAEPKQAPRRGGEDSARRIAELERAHATRRGPRYRSLLWHWLRCSFRRPKPAVAAPLPAVVPGEISVTWAGHATALLRYAALDIACDPMLGRRVRGVKREVEPGLSPAELAGVSLILITSGAADHLHRPTLAKLPRSATIVVPPQAAHRVSDLGFARVVELGADLSLEYRGVEVAGFAVRHAPGRALSYLIRGDGPSAYFCGAGGYDARFADIGRRFRPDLALLPIAGYRPASFRARHMSPLDALCAFEDLQAKIFIPIRFGTFALSYERLHAPERWLAELVAERDIEAFVSILATGESRRWRVGTPAERALVEAEARSGDEDLGPGSDDIDVEVDVDVDVDVDLPQPEPELQPQPEPEQELQPQPRPEPEPQPQPEQELQPEPEPQLQPEPPPHAEAEPQPPPHAEAEPQPPPQQNADDDAELELVLAALFPKPSPPPAPEHSPAREPEPTHSPFGAPAAASIAGAVVAVTAEIAEREEADAADPSPATPPAEGEADNSAGRGAGATGRAAPEGN